MATTQSNDYPLPDFTSDDALKIVEHITSGGVLRHFKGITKAETEVMYDLGYQYYQSHKYEDAEKIFQLLCIYDHLEPKFWIALGATLQLLKQYERAVNIYSYVAIIHPGDLRPALHAGECYLALGNHEKAISAFESVLDGDDGKPVNKPQVDRANALLKLINKSSNPN